MGRRGGGGGGGGWKTVSEGDVSSLRRRTRERLEGWRRRGGGQGEETS